MYKKVRIKSIAKARTGYQVQGSLMNDVPAMGGADYNAYIGTKPSKVSSTITAVPRSVANLEAEGGETVVGDLDGSTMPSFKTIKGPRHSEGGVPLALPDDSFIFSDTKGMKISDPKILKMFNKSVKKGGYTPAELSKQYDINKYRALLQDPNSDKLTRKTAEMMIKNYVMKLGALALAQESKKGFPQGIPLIAQPYMEANGIAEEDLIPELAKQKEAEAQQMEQAQASQAQQQEAPEMMPNGEPVAQPQPMEQGQPQMMEGQMPPIAEYGMEMGGFNLPFAQNGMNFTMTDRNGNIIPPDPNYRPPSIPSIPEMVRPYADIVNTPKEQLRSLPQEELDAWNAANPPEQTEAIMPQKQYGGFPMDEYAFGGFPMYAPGGPITPYEQAKTKQGNITPTGTVNKFSERKQSLDEYLGQWKDLIPGIEKMTEGQAQKAIYDWSLKNNPETIQKMWETHGLTAKGMKSAKLKALSKDGTGKFTAEELKDPKLLAQLEDAYVDNYFGVRQLDPTKATVPPVTPPGTPPEKKKRCECTKSDGTKYDPGMNEDGTCKDCEEEITEPGSPDINIRQQQQKDPEWWLQHTVNAGNAFGDLMGIKKQMPWEARVDLEEPRPTFLDPTRQLAANEEQTNAANQAAASFAGPQSLNARLRANNANASTNAANILSNINNQNVGIANQFEANQVGVRNQEQAMNQQMANRVYDKNVVANQQFQNAKSAGRDNVAQAYNTAVTNRWKTDALNQMYPNYQVSPGSGGRVAFTPTDKTASPIKPTKEIVDYIQELQTAGIDEDIIKELVKGQKKKGGSMFQHGGFIYTVFPAVTL